MPGTKLALGACRSRLPTHQGRYTATSDGLTCGDFRPLVEENGVVGWKLLQRMVKMLRATRQEAHEFENALGTSRHFDDQYPG